MPVKIRLQRQGRKKIPFYHIIVADSRAPRDGRFIEKIGTYNPMTSPATVELDRDRAYEWLMNGAQPSDTVRAILRFKGVLYKKHLMTGVKKGAFSEEEAMSKWQTWIDAKEDKIRKRFEKSANERKAMLKKISGTPPPVPVEEATEAIEDQAKAVKAKAKVEADAEAEVKAEAQGEEGIEGKAEEKVEVDAEAEAKEEEEAVEGKAEEKVEVDTEAEAKGEEVESLKDGTEEE